MAAAIDTFFAQYFRRNLAEAKGCAVTPDACSQGSA
jgi:hypothetical protein